MSQEHSLVLAAGHPTGPGSLVKKGQLPHLPLARNFLFPSHLWSVLGVLELLPEPQNSPRCPSSSRNTTAATAGRAGAAPEQLPGVQSLSLEFCVTQHLGTGAGMGPRLGQALQRKETLPGGAAEAFGGWRGVRRIVCFCGSAVSCLGMMRSPGKLL